MDEAKADRVRQWLRIAQIDLASARRLAGPPDPMLDTAFFHCQEATEKALKGYLAFRDHPLVKTHNIEALLRLAASRDGRFSEWKQAAEKLTPYATEFWYPRDAVEPNEEQYQEAEQAAAGLLAFVCSLLPDDAKPPMNT